MSPISSTLTLLHVGCEEVSAGKPEGVHGEQEVGAGNPNWRGGVHVLDGVIDQADVVEILFLLAGDKAPCVVAVDAHAVLPGDALGRAAGFTHGDIQGGCSVPSGGVGCGRGHKSDGEGAFGGKSREPVWMFLFKSLLSCSDLALFLRSFLFSFFSFVSSVL